MRHQYSEQEDNFIKSCDGSFTVEKVNRFNQLFNSNLSRSSLVNRNKTLKGLNTKVGRNITPSERKWIVEHYTAFKGVVYDWDGLKDAFNKEFDKNFSVYKLQRFIYHNGICVGKSTKKPPNCLPIGSEVMFGNVCYVKVKNDKQEKSNPKNNYQRKK